MTEGSTKALQEAIRNLHGCDSVWIQAVRVKETFQGEIVWEGLVQVFDLIDHPEATRCYAWSHTVAGSERRRFVAVLHKEPVTSPAAAVRASIVQQTREN